MSNRRNSIYPLLIVIPLPPAIHAKEHASTKKVVGNALALNLVTQLYELGAIEPARAPGTKKPADVVRLTITCSHSIHLQIILPTG